MEQKRVLKTLESVASKKFSSERLLLKEVIDQLIENEEINITGGRIWKLNIVDKSYKLISQRGKVQKINSNFSLPFSDYPMLQSVSNERTVLADETNQSLISKGIRKYSASGVGEKISIDKNKYYEYLLAVNSNIINEELKYTLNLVATIITSKLKERRASTTQKNLIADIDKAKQLQRSILPEHEFNFHSYEMFGFTIPAETVGGDFFDYIYIGRDENRVGVVVGDAASKGLAAAAEAMYISGALRMASTFQLKISPLMYRLNNLINKIFSDDKFTTLFYCEVSDDKRGLCLYANAGHNPPIFVCKKEKKVIKLNPTGPLLGPAPKSAYETDSINFYDGDVLVIYSDGITEATNNKYEFYGEERLEKVIKKNLNKSSKDLSYLILNDVLQFSNDDPKYQDDKTIVVIKKNEQL